MTPPSETIPSIASLAAELTGRGSDDPLANDLIQWLSSSRFFAFATTYRSKIRKKVHNAADAEALRDVRTELLTAHRLLADKRFTVAYETYGAGRPGPDLTVAFRATTTFNVEVTRMRRPPDPAAVGATLLAKLRQLPPSVANIVVLASERPASTIDIAGSVRALRARADARDDAVFASAGLESGRGFYERFLRLGAVMTWCDEADGIERAALWANPSARIPVPERAGQACLVCLRGS